MLDALFALVEQARANLPDTLKTGLTDPETRELLMTRDVARAVQLVPKGLESRLACRCCLPNSNESRQFLVSD